MNTTEFLTSGTSPVTWELPVAGVVAGRQKSVVKTVDRSWRVKVRTGKVRVAEQAKPGAADSLGGAARCSCKARPVGPLAANYASSRLTLCIKKRRFDPALSRADAGVSAPTPLMSKNTAVRMFAGIRERRQPTCS